MTQYKSLQEIIKSIDQMDYITHKERAPVTFREWLRIWSRNRKRKWLERQVADLEKEQANIARAIGNYLRELEGL